MATKKTNKNQKLLVCVGNSDHSLVALKFACSKAKKAGFAIEIITVIDTSTKSQEGLFAVDDIFQKEKRDETEKILNDYADKVYEWAKIRPVLNVREGFIYDEIKSTVESDKTISMIILSASPDSTSNGKLIPYLAEQLSLKLFVPLMIVPNNLTDAQIEKIS